MVPVVSWLERRRGWDKAEIVKRRLLSLLDQAIRCARFEIPEYADGVIRPSTGSTPSEGARQTAEMAVFAEAFAGTLQEWAAEIEADERASPIPATSVPRPPMPTAEPVHGAGLSITDKGVLAIIKRQRRGQGIQGKAIISALRERSIDLKESTLRRHVLPKLRVHGVQNSRAAGGYLVPRQGDD
jgi:hypothetical protein